MIPDATDTELQKVARELRSRASDVANADFQGAPARIRRLLDYVENTEVLRQQIARCPEPKEDPLEVLEEVRTNGGHFPAPTDDRKHLGLIHALFERMLDYAEEEGEREFWRLGHRYANESGLHEGISALLHEVAGDYKEHLERPLLNAMIDQRAEQGDQRQAVLHVVQHGDGQFNLTHAGGQIEATQSHGADASAVVAAASELVDAAHADDEIDAETRSMLLGLATQVKMELQQEGGATKSRLEEITGRLRTAASMLTSGTTLYSKSTELADAIGKLVGMG